MMAVINAVRVMETTHRWAKPGVTNPHSDSHQQGHQLHDLGLLSGSFDAGSMGGGGGWGGYTMR